MRRLWVRLSLMIGGTLFLVFFMQFAAIMLSEPLGDAPPGVDADGPNAAGRAEVAARIVDFMLLSAVVGLVGGVLIGWVVSSPMNDLARVARRVGAGDLATRGSGRAAARKWSNWQPHSIIWPTISSERTRRAAT